MTKLPSHSLPLTNINVVAITENIISSKSVKGLIYMEDNLFLALGIKNEGLCCVILMTEENLLSSIYAVASFKTSIPIVNLESLSVGVMKLHTFLSGDIEFLSNVIGHQGCSAISLLFLLQ